MEENIALCHESLLERYEEGALDDEAVCQAIRHRRVFPVMFGSALKLQGVEEFLDCLNRFTLAPRRGGSFGARVYKIGEDKGSRLTYMKITGGTLRVRDVLRDPRVPDGEKVTGIRIYSGERFRTAETAEAGDVCAVTGLSFARSGDGLGSESSAVQPLLEPVLTYSVLLPKEIDVHTALAKLRVLEAEDPQLNVAYNERYGQIQLRLMGDIQLEVLKA